VENSLIISEENPGVLKADHKVPAEESSIRQPQNHGRLEWKILRVLQDSEASAQEVADLIMASPARVLERLKWLEQIGLLESEWKSYKKVYIHR